RGRLSKELKLFDVFAISTGAMFSSGFFLLPGLASAQAGPAVVVAYLLAGLLVVPAMLSKAELSTAMPRAGGTYYFLDRSLGPLVGAVGGLGTWAALILKSAFAIIGMGAYLTLFVEVPMTALAIALTIFFTLINLVGAKETSRLQVGLVVVLLAVLTFFVVQGLVEVWSLGLGQVGRTQLTPFLPFGSEGLFATVGLVFVSYAGLTKVASVAEEVEDPDRNIPLGMALSLVTATAFYVVGVFVMVAVLEPGELRADLTPAATAAAAFFDWLPGSVGLILVVVAAIAAFASTGNAGIMSASRYLLAMGRDHVVSPRFATLGRFRTPSLALGLTCVVMILCLVFLDVMSVAKLASAFQLLIFAFINLAVVVLRESRIEGYEPGFSSPLYPWMQVAGFLAPLWLITEMGALTVLFTGGMIIGTLLWYHYYAREHMAREGAVLHLFERLGRQRDPGLDRELRAILTEHGPGDRDPFVELVAGARVVDVDDATDYEAVVWQVSAHLSSTCNVPAHRLAAAFIEESRIGLTPQSRGVAFPHLRLPGLRSFQLVLVRLRNGVDLPLEDPEEHEQEGPARALFFLVSPESEARGHLQFLAALAERVDKDDFMVQWLAASSEQELKEALLHTERFFSVQIADGGPTADLAGAEIREITFVAGALIALVHRRGRVLIPTGRMRLEVGDRLTIVGEAAAIRELRKRFGTAASRPGSGSDPDAPPAAPPDPSTHRATSGWPRSPR
ncbi:MAG: amino acid permease, partial [Longimicrobiales bacterium]|nr:amino acid permease [Longimicrobiales bacterium]